MSTTTRNGGIVLAFGVSVLLFIALVALKVRTQGQLHAAAALADSAIAAFRQEVDAHNRLLGPGDSLPAVSVRDGGGEVFALRTLPQQGYPYLYFYKDPCPPCDILRPLLAESRNGIKDSVAFVAFRQPATGFVHHYSWTEGTESGAVRGVPTLLHVAPSGRVINAAHNSIFRAAQFMDMLGLLKKAEVDSIVSVLRAGG